jgi:hypothetical protein
MSDSTEHASIIGPAFTPAIGADAEPVVAKYAIAPGCHRTSIDAGEAPYQPAPNEREKSMRDGSRRVRLTSCPP